MNPGVSKRPKGREMKLEVTSIGTKTCGNIPVRGSLQTLPNILDRWITMKEPFPDLKSFCSFSPYQVKQSQGFLLRNRDSPSEEQLCQMHLNENRKAFLPCTIHCRLSLLALIYIHCNEYHHGNRILRTNSLQRCFFVFSFKKKKRCVPREWQKLSFHLLDFPPTSGKH